MPPEGGLPDAAVIAIITGIFGFLALIPAYLINKRTARKDEFAQAQAANQQAFANLEKLYQAAIAQNEELSKRLDEVVADNTHYRTENTRLLKRNEKLEDENRQLLRQNSEHLATIKDLSNRVERLEGKKRA